MTGKELQANIIELANILGYRVAHFRAARTKHGWATPVGADGRGFPDLVLIGRGQSLYREIKGDGDRLRAEQVQWGAVLQQNGADWAVWTPRSWVDGTVLAELQND